MNLFSRRYDQPFHCTVAAARQSAGRTLRADALSVAVISLDDQSARRALLMARGLPDEWVEGYWAATDFRDLPYDALQQYADTRRVEEGIGRRIRPGEVGCSLSHKRASEWLLRHRASMLLVLEDDVVPLVPEIEAEILKVANILEPAARSGRAFICHLGAREDQVAHAISRRVRTLRRFDSTALRKHIDPGRTVWRAHAYLISRGAAKRSREIEHKIFTLADDWRTRRMCGLFDHLYFTSPRLFAQDENVTTLGELPTGKQSLDAVREDAMNRELFHRAAASIRFRSSIMHARLLSMVPHWV